MNNYYDLLTKIILKRLNISIIYFRNITDIQFREFGINVYYEYWHGNKIYTSDDIIYNSEINAYIFEQSFNK